MFLFCSLFLEVVGGFFRQVVVGFFVRWWWVFSSMVLSMKEVLVDPKEMATAKISYDQNHTKPTTTNRIGLAADSRSHKKGRESEWVGLWRGGR